MDGSPASIPREAEFVAWAKPTLPAPHRRTQLAAIPDCGDVDAWIVDGDHNWYTSITETHAIAARARGTASRCWSSITTSAGRRAAATCIMHGHDPAEFPIRTLRRRRFPGRYDLVLNVASVAWAISLGHHEAASATAYHGNRDFPATKPRPGVITCSPKCRPCSAGVLFATDAPWSQAVAEIVCLSRQCADRRLEENRLVNYLT